MDRIALIYRKKLNGRHSIERLFSPMDNLSNINRLELPYDLTSLASAVKLFLFALKIKEKTIHITGDVHYMALFLFWKNVIITVHDSYHFEGMKGFKKHIYGLIWFKIPLKVAKVIVVVSPNTKDRLIENFKISSDKIKVIPNSITRDNVELRKIKKNKEFTILVIGTKANKNIQRLIIALKGLNDVKLDIVGNITQPIFNLLKKCKINFDVNSDISDNKLTYKLKSSNLLYMASIQEGFGLPILEAQVFGLPVLTSNISPMDYVAGRGAIFVDPYSVEDIADKIKKIKKGLIDVNNIVKEGYKNVERFSLVNFINSYKEIYKNI